MKKIAVFGSLKKGFYNHASFNLGEPIAHSSIRGEMHLCYSYPHLFRPEVSKQELVRTHPVEIYEIEDHTYNSIRNMEIGAGYQEYKTTLKDTNGVDHDVTVFYTEDLNTEYKRQWIDGYNKETVPHAYKTFN